ncbi:hypothetical protein QJS10_CPB21g01100 [Acorus calamus]|uniref:Uncharacterized protein n=1 Tax=Acorus calamus TaxID=4465 RepID=A0AAV9C6R8_ACOCL|nr:hypothetical protein QJS10_CPB21g01100 [Acorus calamus]
MDLPEESHHHRRNPNGNDLYLMNDPDSAFFEIRLFYVRLYSTARTPSPPTSPSLSSSASPVRRPPRNRRSPLKMDALQSDLSGWD